MAGPITKAGKPKKYKKRKKRVSSSTNEGGWGLR
ncbi:hypothetical protein SLEP1_g31330 [Rubroshorea leprosula]|uniref:Uncharacterized protein n=1 Tax=Rubroshorea leprosula TaxID=152421 RepID=A0AAV5K7W3_9ROSI|nr:hypothetical protein SLEP1_g31330 [Rubroshorea leprosula]